MKLEFVEIDLLWPKSLDLEGLRGLVVTNLRDLGDPLRWAITYISSEVTDSLERKIKVEAVLIKEE